MSLSTTSIIKNSNFLAGIYLIFLKAVLDLTWKPFHTEFWPQLKDRKSNYQVGNNLAIFCNLVSLSLD